MADKKEPDSAKAKKSDLHLEDRFEPQRLLPIEAIVQTGRVQVELEKINHIAQLLWLPKYLTEEEKNARIVTAIDLFESIKPQEGIEAMLATQMVAAHFAATECLRRAMLEDQTFEGRQASLNQAQRLMALYIQQLSALDKHRGKGQQRITVERLNVNSGGQAVVGEIHAPTRAEPPSPANTPTDSAAAPAALTAQDPQLGNLPPARKRSKTRR